MKRFTNTSRWWPYVVIVMLWFVFASPYFLKGLIPFPSKYLVTFFPPWSATYGMPVKNNAMPDVITQIYPWKRLTIDIWRQGQVPLWNPNTFAGSPLAGNYQSAVFSPFNLLFFLTNQIDAWAILILLQPILAGIFMFWFLKSLDRTDVGSCIGAVAFMFSGFLVVWMAYGTLGYALLFLPLCLFAIRRQRQHPTWWNGVLLSLGLALSFVSGHFQTSLYVAGLTFCYLIFEALRTPGRVRGFSLLFFFFLGFLLASPQILLSLDAYKESIRATSFVKNAAIPWQYLITIFAPDFYGNPVTRNDWLGYYAEWASYIGVIPLLLALFSMGRKKTPEMIFFIGAVVATILLAYATPVSSLVAILKIPIFSTSAGNRIIAITSFSLAVLSAFGLDALENDWEKRNRRWVITYCLIVLGIVAIIGVVLLVGKPFSADAIAIAKRNMILPTALACSFIVIAAAGLVRKWKVGKVTLFLLLALVAFDLSRYAAKWMPFDPREYIYPAMGMTEYLSKVTREDRVFGNVGNEFSSFFNLPSLEGYDALYNKRYGEFITSLSDGNIGEPQRSVVLVPKGGRYTQQALDLLGVKYLAHRLSDGRNVWAYHYWDYPGYQSVYKDEYYEVLQNSTAFPRAFLVSRYELKTSPQEILNLLWSPVFSRGDSVILEEEPTLKPSAGAGAVTLVSSLPNEITYTVRSESPKLLFLSDSYEKGWKATVDNVPTPIYRADYAFRAVPVPAGEHVVRFMYRPIGYSVGAPIAGFALLVLLAGSVKYLYDHRVL